MTTDNFCYWLQGYSEICGRTPNETQWKIIQDHLQLVFQKETPNRGSSFIPKKWIISGGKTY